MAVRRKSYTFGGGVNLLLDLGLGWAWDDEGTAFGEVLLGHDG